MKKFILINEEVLVRLQEGKYVEGTLHIDKCTGVITFNAWVRKKPKHRWLPATLRIKSKQGFE